MGNIIVEAGQTFVTLTMGMSFVSIVRGHINYISAGKKGHLGFLGKVILAAYVSVGLAGRLWAFLMFFTPILGLFNILKMAELGTMGASNTTVTNIYLNGTVITLAQKWNEEFKFDFLLDIYSAWPITAVYVTIALGLCSSHLIVGTCTQRKYIALNIGLDNVIHTLVCPPLYPDWEEIYWTHEGSLKFYECWKRFQKCLRTFVLLFVCENVALCIPLATLRFTFEQRRNHLEANFFPLLPEEALSIQIADSLLFPSLIGLAIVLPLCQFSLALAYLRYGHPWASLMTREVCV